MFSSLESVVICGDSAETLGIEEATWEGWGRRLLEVRISLEDYRARWWTYWSEISSSLPVATAPSQNAQEL